MQEILFAHYLVLKSLHVISVIAWMAGMFYLPRLFVYHAGATVGSELSETFKTMERKLLRYIMNPAMSASWLFGGLMLWANPELFHAPWMHVKLACVLLMTWLHHIYALWRKDFFRDKNENSHKLYRWWNEAPTVLMIVIVVMAIVKPLFGGP